MTPTTFKKFNDPGHGWLQVTKAQLVEAHVTGLITAYSRVDDTHVYLEEDCDAPLFLESIEYPYVIQEIHSNEVSPIRSKRSYRVEETL